MRYKEQIDGKTLIRHKSAHNAKESSLITNLQIVIIRWNVQADIYADDERYPVE